MKIYVDVYLAKNLGDDLFVHVLANTFPDVEFILNYYGNDYDDFLKKYKNVKKSAYPSGFKILNRLKVYDYINDEKRISKEYDALIFLGGSIFREEVYWKELYEQRKKLVNAFQEKKKPVFILGANFGPYDTDEFYNAYQELFKKCYDVCFRESYSYQLFRECKNVRCEKDINFQLPILDSIPKKNKVVYSIIDPKHKEGLKKYTDQYIQFVEDMIMDNQAQGYENELISFCEAEGDLRICRTIQEDLLQRNLRINVYAYTGNIKEVIKKIQESKLIVASRFHANILGLITGTLILPLVYSSKTENVLKDIDFNGKILDIKDCSKEKNNCHEILQKEQYIKQFDKVVESSKRQFKGLKEWMEIEKKKGL